MSGRNGTWRAPFFTNISIYDGTGKRPFRGEVSIQDNRIEKVAKNGHKLSRRGAAVVEGDGATLMPGLVNAHCHMSFTGPKSMSEIPPEEHTLITMHNAKTILDHGVTAAVGAGAAKHRLDIVIRNEINAGRIPGPRFRACSPEITVTGGLGDRRMLHFYKNDVSLFADGPEEIRRACRMLIREGVDIIKLMPSGDHLNPRCVRCHPERDGRGRDRRRAHRLRISGVAGSRRTRVTRTRFGCVSSTGLSSFITRPTRTRNPSICWRSTRTSTGWCRPSASRTRPPMKPATSAFHPKWQPPWALSASSKSAAETLKKMHARGIKVLPFGDQGFAWTPHRQMARDFEHFTNYLGMKPYEILRAATHYGAQAFGAPDELGRIKTGYLADLLLIDGNPLADLTLFQDEANILMIMKDGVYHKLPQARQRAVQQAAAE